MSKEVMIIADEWKGYAPLNQKFLNPSCVKTC